MENALVGAFSVIVKSSRRLGASSIGDTAAAEVTMGAVGSQVLRSAASRGPVPSLASFHLNS